MPTRTRRAAPAKTAPVKADSGAVAVASSVIGGSSSPLAAAHPMSSPPTEEQSSLPNGEEAEQEEEDGEQDTEPHQDKAHDYHGDHSHRSPGLQFDESLSWRAGRQIPVAELLKRLQKLDAEMRDMEQDDDDGVRASFIPVAKELAGQQLLGHKDRGVRAWVACCVVDILRLCAPDAPFTHAQLKSIFEMIIKSILSSLSDPSDAYNTQHVYVLQSLAEVKSIVLVADLPASDSLMVLLFSTLFDILSGTSKTSTGEQIAKAVSMHMSAILTILVDETQKLPQETVDIIVAQFLRADPRIVGGGTSESSRKKGAPVDTTQSILTMTEYPPAYNAAKTICNACSEKMAREIGNYFNDVIVDASGSTRGHHRDNGDGDVPETPTAFGPSEEDLKEIDKAHRLLRELWRACPMVLQNIVPQMEAELGAENVYLRVLATETLGDIASGIGAAGPPPSPAMDPAAYPPVDLSATPDSTSHPANILTTPLSPHPFLRMHSQAYNAFLGRRQDKSPLVRAAWVRAIGRILATSAGGTGLNQEEETRLVGDIARMLNDSDDKVRLAAVKVVSMFSLKDIVGKLGSSGGVDDSGSVLGNLAERVKDRKQLVRTEAMTVFGRIWAVASGEIAAGNEEVTRLLGGAPSKILNTFYTNDQEIIVLMDKVLFEILLPLAYPPIKAKGGKQTNGSSQRVKDSQGTGSDEAPSRSPAEIRVERILVLAKGLDERAKRIFMAFSSRQLALSKFMRAYLQACEEYNGGVIDQHEAAVKERLSRIVAEMAKFLPDPTKVTSDLWKFAKLHDRRAYQLIRFCMAPESDYRTMFNAQKEFLKRMDSGSTAALLETLVPLLYRSSITLYNKSHIPAIMEYAKTERNELGGIAQDILTDVSQQTPEVLKAQVREICLGLQENAPTESKPSPLGIVESLKACSAFARKFPEEIPQDAKFVEAMCSFALLGNPPESAKYAVSIIMAASNKKEMLARTLVRKCVKGFAFGKPGFVARLASLSRFCLLAPAEADEEANAIIDIATKEVLLKVRNPASPPSNEYTWSSDVDDECAAKCWAIKILVNRVRAHKDATKLAEVAKPAFDLLNTLVASEGELSKAKDTPASHKPRLRLTAARAVLKLCLAKDRDALLTPQAFNKLAEVAQDSQFAVRLSFLGRLRKYLSKNVLPSRFYTIPFLLAFEPEPPFKAETTTWIKSRVAFFGSFQPGLASNSSGDSSRPKTSTVLEQTIARLLSLLAHHPDYGDEPEDLVDQARYIIFYLSSVATEKSISLIYHIAQRVKSCRDALSATQPLKTSTPRAKNANADMVSPDEYSTRLHTLSDVACFTIRSFVDAHGWTLQSLPARVGLPHSLFSEIKDHASAIWTAEKNFMPEVAEEKVEALVRAALRRSQHQQGSSGTRKRRSDGHFGGSSAKKAKVGSGTKLAVRESREGKEKGRRPTKRQRRSWEDKSEDGVDDTSDEEESRAPSRKKANGVPNERSAARRKSGRVSQGAAKLSYRERDDSEDDAEMNEANDANEVGAGSDDASSDRVEDDQESEGEEEDVDEAEEEIADDEHNDAAKRDDEEDSKDKEEEETSARANPGRRGQKLAATIAGTRAQPSSGTSKLQRQSQLQFQPVPNSTPQKRKGGRIGASAASPVAAMASSPPSKGSDSTAGSARSAGKTPRDTRAQPVRASARATRSKA